MTNDDDKMLWQRIKGPASSPSRLGPHPEQPASSPSRLASLAPQDEDAGSGGAVTPHPEAAAQRPSKDVDLLQLSAWIDGRLDREEADAVEARLADDPQSLELALAAEQVLGLAAPWPKRAQARAAAIVAPARLSLRVLVAAIAAMLLLALGGFEMGSIGSETTAAANGAETDLAVEFGLLPGADIVEVSL